MQIANFRIVGGIIVEKWERENEGKISYDHAIEITATSQNSLAGGSRCKPRQLPQLILTQKELQYFSESCAQHLETPVAKQKFLEIRCCLRKCFEKNWQLL